MIIVEKISELKELLDLMNGGKSRIGFVPTMGALHEGHISLIKRAKAENQIVVSSIFVNPAQFHDQNDLKQYPRTPEADAQLLSDVGCDVLFAPAVAEIYPDDLLLDIDFGRLERVMEGQFRPGHFRGVATVVSRFFDLIKPQKAYFGEKDFQQLVIIKELNNRLHSGITIIGCETFREPDGLAMSSRNIHLTQKEREFAGIIYRSLTWAADNIRLEQIGTIRKVTIEKIESFPGFKVQYLEFVYSETLQSIDKWEEGRPQRACVAVLTSGTRLIDNVAI